MAKGPLSVNAKMSDKRRRRNDQITATMIEKVNSRLNGGKIHKIPISKREESPEVVTISSRYPGGGWGPVVRAKELQNSPKGSQNTSKGSQNRTPSTQNSTKIAQGSTKIAQNNGTQGTCKSTQGTQTSPLEGFHTKTSAFASYVEWEMAATKARTREWTRLLSEPAPLLQTKDKEARRVVFGMVQREKEWQGTLKGLQDMIVVDEVADSLEPSDRELLLSCMNDNSNSSNHIKSNSSINNIISNNSNINSNKNSINKNSKRKVVELEIPGELERVTRLSGIREEDGILPFGKGPKKEEEVVEMLELPGDMKRVKQIVGAGEDETSEDIREEEHYQNSSFNDGKGTKSHPFEKYIEQNTDKVRELLMAKKSLKEITTGVGCNAPFVYQVRRTMISELLDGNIEIEVISEMLGCNKEIISRLQKNVAPLKKTVEKVMNREEEDNTEKVKKRQLRKRAPTNYADNVDMVDLDDDDADYNPSNEEAESPEPPKKRSNRSSKLPKVKKLILYDSEQEEEEDNVQEVKARASKSVSRKEPERKSLLLKHVTPSPEVLQVPIKFNFKPQTTDDGDDVQEVNQVIESLNNKVNRIKSLAQKPVIRSSELTITPVIRSSELQNDERHLNDSGLGEESEDYLGTAIATRNPFSGKPMIRSSELSVKPIIRSSALQNAREVVDLGDDDPEVLVEEGDQVRTPQKPRQQVALVEEGNNCDAQEDATYEDNMTRKVWNLLVAKNKVERISKTVGCSKLFVVNVRKKKILELLSAKVEVQDICNMLNCPPTLVRNLKGIKEEIDKGRQQQQHYPKQPSFEHHNDTNKTNMTNDIVEEADPLANEVTEVSHKSGPSPLPFLSPSDPRERVRELLMAKTAPKEICKAVACTSAYIYQVINLFTN